MKKVLFSVFFFSLMVVGAQAQKSACAKSCAAKPSSASVSACSDSNAAAAKLASMDPTIETRTCPASGKVSYVRKQASTDNGAVSYVDVSYDATSNSFVNVSPMKMEGGAGCAPKATSASGKSDCSSKSASGKACCAGKGKTASATSTTTTMTPEGKAVKTSAPVKN